MTELQKTFDYSHTQRGTLDLTTRRLSWISESVNWGERAGEWKRPPHLGGREGGGGTHLQASGLTDRLQSRAAEQAEGPLPTAATSWPLLEAQREHPGGQEDVPVGGVTLRQFTHHPAGGGAEQHHTQRLCIQL